MSLAQAGARVLYCENPRSFVRHRPAVAEVVDNVYRFQQKCDAAASHGAPQFRRLIVSTVVLHVIATLIAAMTLAYGMHNEALPWAKLACLTGALAVAMVLRHHGHSRHSWVRCRLAAEFCRSALATWGLPQDAPLFENLDLPGVRGLGRSLHILHSRSFTAQPIAMDEFKRVIDQELASK